MQINKIYNVDCLKFMAKMKDKSVDLIVTDPPYELNLTGTGLKKPNDRHLKNIYQDKSRGLSKIVNGFDIDKTLSEFERVCKIPNFFIFCSNAQIARIMSWGQERGYSSTCLVWHKPNTTPFTNNTWKSDLEYCIHIKAKGGLCQGGYEIKSRVFTRGVAPSKYGHPTEKPLELIKKFILVGSNENDLIFDPFMGSGTTAVAAKELKRNFIGCEIEDKYCEIANKRLLTAPNALFGV